MRRLLLARKLALAPDGNCTPCDSRKFFAVLWPTDPPVPALSAPPLPPPVGVAVMKPGGTRYSLVIRVSVASLIGTMRTAKGSTLNFRLARFVM